jgi:hypothetical protein
MKFEAQVLVVSLLSVPAFAGGPVEPVEYPAVAAPAPVIRHLTGRVGMSGFSSTR